MLLLLLTRFADAEALRLSGEITIAAGGVSPAVRLAVLDLARDCEKVLGKKAMVVDAREGDVCVIATEGGAPESYRVSVTAKQVRIEAPDELGLIYGIYAFSQQCLGVDPYWFWKDIKPAARTELLLEAREIRSAPARFRYRGWFINDEDLLTEWKQPSGARHIDYPFYAQVINLEVADRIFETLLRTGGNLVIPASFVDVMNEPEAALVRRAVERGLYVTQHHIEPMGMSHFGFENYWKARGENVKLAYGKDPKKVHETWRAFAKKWHEVAGDKVVWQIGLRGRGDRALWASDTTVSAAEAGKIISGAMEEQVKIVREVDPRADAPITTTLWLEMSKLMSGGGLKIPPRVSIVFCDEGQSQLLQEDFETTAREAGRGYGLYYHVGFWKNGPHLLMGTRPEKLAGQFKRVIDKKDTHYAIINVTNIREHVLGIETAMSIMRGREAWDRAAFMKGWAPAKVAEGYEEYLSALAEPRPGVLLQDGHTYSMGEALLAAMAKGQKAKPMFFESREAAIAALERSMAQLDALITGFDDRVKGLAAEEEAFHRRNLLAQAKQLRGLYGWLVGLLKEDRAAAVAGLESVIAAREVTATGTWEGWYRGDKKANVPRLLERTRSGR